MRAYPTFADFGRMVARSAFAELRYSPLRLAGAVGGMALVYLAPPLFAVFARGVGASGRRARLGDDGAGARADAAPIWTAARWRPRPSRHRRSLCRLHLRLRATILAGARRLLERANPGADAGDGARMTTVSEALSGKEPSGREFSRRLMAPERASGAVRSSPSIASCAPPTTSPITRRLSPETKLKLLDDLDDALTGRGPPPIRKPSLCGLRLPRRGLSPKHALDLLKAFRLDARKNRYANWSELMDYCALSAAPVGRFVLDVHEEDPSIWPASDALCSALQVINHLQDCAEDYRRLDRVYLPLDTLAAHGASVEMLDAPKAPPALRGALAELARRTSELVARGAALIPQIRDMRLGAEIAAIHALARRLARDLESRDPLSERVHLGKAGFALVGGLGAARFLGLGDDALGRARGRKRPHELASGAGGAQFSFYTAMRILPERQREAMFALYGFCRAVDDIADERGPATAAAAPGGAGALARRHRRDVRGPGAAASRRPRSRRRAAIDLKQEDFDAVIDGMAMDAERGHSRARLGDARPLLRPGRRPPSAGFRCAFSALPPEPGEALAHHLGRALQLTNILRDIDEDASVGRLYLPREALARRGRDDRRSAGGGGGPEARRSLRRGGRARSRAFREGRVRSWRRRRERRSRRRD